MWSRVEIICNDININEEYFGKAFIVMWIEMVKENCRELNYNASEAGVKQTIKWNEESLIITTQGYNEAYESFFVETFKNLVLDFDNSSFFESKRKQCIATIENLRRAEPMNSYTYLLSDILIDGVLTLET